MYRKIILLCLLVLAHCQNNQNKGHGNDASKFDVVILAEGIFTSTEDTILFIFSKASSLLDFLDGSLKFIIYLISTLTDQLIRQPINLVILILQAFSWTLNMFVYIFLDILLHAFIKECLVLVIGMTTFFAISLIELVTRILLGIVLFSKSIILTYLNLTSVIFIYIILPCFESLFWTLSFFVIIMLGLSVIFVIKNEKYMIQSAYNMYGIRAILFFILLVVAIYNLWVTFCSAIYSYMCYPAMVLLYCLCTTYFPYRLIKLCINNCEHIFHNFNEEHVARIFLQGRNAMLYIKSKFFETKQAQIWKGHAEDSSLKHDQNETFYNDRECVICFNERTLVTLSPCEHKVMCRECTNRILENDYRCPICRATIRFHHVSD